MKSSYLSFKESLSSLSLLYLLLFIPLSYFVNLLLQEGLQLSISVSAILYGIAFILGVLTYAIFAKKIKTATFLIISILIIGTFLYYVFYPTYFGLIYTSIIDLAYNPVIILFAYCIPVLIMSSSGYVNYEIVYRYSILISRIVLILLIVCFFAFGVGTSVWGGQYMSTTYNAMPAYCICAINYVRKKKYYLLDGILAALALFITLVGGSRGALLCDIALILLLVIISPNQSKNRKILIVFSSIIACIIVILLFDKFLLVLESFVSSKGLYSRTLTKISSNTFYQSNDRLLLWQTIFAATNKSPLIGYGVWGDRPIINGYTHNLFLELCCSYGYLIGGSVSIALVVGIIRYIKNHSRFDNEYFYFLYAMPYGFFQLMFSDSYLYNVWFFSIVGILISNIKRNKNESNTSL